MAFRIAMTGGATPDRKMLPTTANETYVVGELLVMTTGALTKCAATATARYVCNQNYVAPATGQEPISVTPITDNLLFETVFSADATLVNVGDKVTIASDGLRVTATTTAGVAEIARKLGTGAAGTGVWVRLRPADPSTSAAADTQIAAAFGLAVTLTDDLTVGGNLAVTGTSALTGNTAITGTLAVTGASTLTGALTANGGITAKDVKFVSSNVDATNDVTASAANNAANVLVVTAAGTSKTITLGMTAPKLVVVTNSGANDVSVKNGAGTPVVVADGETALLLITSATAIVKIVETVAG
ncbi:MAG: hypothetical protein EOM51_10295 [Clostridia bacterium]|nr:hypothetical protein [Clostridia bacterium]